MGGIPGGGGSRDATGMADVRAEARATADGWKSAGEKAAKQISRTVEAAKEFRERLKSQKKGTGANEKGKYETTALLEDDFGEELGEGWVEGWGKVEYLSTLEKAPYELSVKDGKIVDTNGKYMIPQMPVQLMVVKVNRFL